MLTSAQNRADVAVERLRGAFVRVIRGYALSSGTGLMVASNVDFQLYGRVRLGKNVRLSAGCLLSVGPSAELDIGDDCFIGRNTVIAAAESIRIGSHVDIAEHCSIRDADHDLSAEGRASGRALTAPVVIGDGSWIGAGARVLRGTILGRGVVVAANAVVKGTFEERTLVGGVPARSIRSLP